MTDKDQQTLRTTLAFNAEAARAGLFAAALDMAEEFKKADIPNGEAALITGALEMAVQLYMQVILAAGVTRQAARLVLLKQVKTFASKHSRPRETAVAS